MEKLDKLGINNHPLPPKFTKPVLASDLDIIIDKLNVIINGEDDITEIDWRGNKLPTAKFTRPVLHSDFNKVIDVVNSIVDIINIESTYFTPLKSKLFKSNIGNALPPVKFTTPVLLSDLIKLITKINEIVDYVGSNVNPDPPIPEGAIQFENSLEYIHFENNPEEYITFEITE